MAQTHTNGSFTPGIDHAVLEGINLKGKSIPKNGAIRIRAKSAGVKNKKGGMKSRRTGEDLDNIVYSELKALGGGPIETSILLDSLEKKNFSREHAGSHLRRMATTSKLLSKGKFRKKTYELVLSENTNRVNLTKGKRAQILRVSNAASKQAELSLARRLVAVCNNISQMTLDLAHEVSVRDDLIHQIDG